MFSKDVKKKLRLVIKRLVIVFTGKFNHGFFTIFNSFSIEHCYIMPFLSTSTFKFLANELWHVNVRCFPAETKVIIL